MKKKQAKNTGKSGIREKLRCRKSEVKGITLIALVITIVLNCSYLAMERMLKKEKILKKEETSSII